MSTKTATAPKTETATADNATAEQKQAEIVARIKEHAKELRLMGLSQDENGLNALQGMTDNAKRTAKGKGIILSIVDDMDDAGLLHKLIVQESPKAIKTTKANALKVTKTTIGTGLGETDGQSLFATIIANVRSKVESLMAQIDNAEELATMKLDGITLAKEYGETVGSPDMPVPAKAWINALIGLNVRTAGDFAKANVIAKHKARANR